MFLGSLELTSLAPFEMTSLATMLNDGSTTVTAPEIMIASICCLAGRAHGQHGRQCAEGDETDPPRTCKVLHVDTSFPFPSLLDAYRFTKIHSSRVYRP